ncbi:transposase [Brucella pituitosa]|uniref:transposase n=1 Tax=Brucella pituitosa TaxID=571256 RepID=UPI000FE25758|nr:transposase [Brucella pituitosa]
MADETITDAKPAATAINAAEPVGDMPKTRAPRKKAAPKQAKTSAVSPSTATKVGTKPAKAPKAAAKAKPVVTQPAKRTVKRYSPEQRAAILASIEKATKGGKVTLQAALQQAEVSEQTYYNWKNAEKAAPTAVRAPSGDDLKTLVTLEAENLKLRKELASKLRAENAELRKRLGKA